MADYEDSNFLRHEPCPKCGSKDNLSRYDDGHAYCEGCKYYEHADGKPGEKTPETAKAKRTDLLDIGDYGALPARGISEETCRKFKYFKTTFSGKKAQVVGVANADGVVVAQKIRFKNKTFKYIGDTKEACLVGIDVWQSSGRKIVITEGEIDMLSVSQLQGNKYPVVSVPNGASGAAKSIKKALEYVCSFDEVVFMFDMDAPGKAAAAECAALLPIGKAKIASLPLKDANECLVAGRGAEVIEAIWRAKEFRPDGIIAFGDLKDKVLMNAEKGKPWIFDTLTEATYGRRPGEVYFIGAGTGVGKTDFMTQQAAADIQNGDKVALFFLEQPNVETAKRLAGKVAKRRFHVPDDGWTEDELLAAFDMLDNDCCYLYDHFGSTEWDTVKSQMRFLAVKEDVKHFYIDHLTAFAAHAEDERKALEGITADMSSFAQELQVNLYVVSHLATPEGKPHEEGGRVMIRHFKGSRAIGFWAHFMFGLERNQQAENEEERQTTTFRILKDRYTGQATGKTFYLGYLEAGGILYEKEWEPPVKGKGKAKESPFVEEF